MLLYSCMNVQIKEFFCTHNIGISRRVSISKLKIEMEEKENGIFSECSRNTADTGGCSFELEEKQWVENQDIQSMPGA